jgi:hypothetical protein
MRVSGGFVCGAWIGLLACQAALDLDDYTFDSPDVPAYSGSGGGVSDGGGSTGGASTGGANTGGANTGGANAGGVSGADGGRSAQAGAAGSAGSDPGRSAGAESAEGVAGASPGSGPLRISSGYATNGPFHGYSYTFVVVSTDPAARPVSISPVCDDNGCVPAFEDNAICARGVVGAAPDFVSSAYAGFDLNQDQAGAIDSVLLMGQSLMLTFTNPGASDLRVQLVTPDGTTYCHALGQTPSPAVLPLVEFDTACWDDTGSRFVTSLPVSALHLVVPSVDNADVSFEFCLLDVATR